MPSSIPKALHAIHESEHDEDSPVAKRVLAYGYDSDNLQKVRQKVDSDGHLQVDVVSGGTAGTQYTEGDTEASIVGTAMLWEDSEDTLSTVSASSPLPVDASGNAVPVTDNDGSLTVDNTALTELADAINANRVDVNIAADGAGGVEVVQDTAADLNVTEASAAEILADTDIIAGDTTSIDGKITVCNTGDVAISSFPDNEPFDLAQYGGVAVGVDNAVHVQPGTGIIFDVDATGQGDVPVTLDGETVDISDRAARDLGKVDIAGFDGTLPAGTEIIGKVYLTDGTEDAAVNASNEIQVRDDDANTDLDTIAGDTTSIDGKITTCNTGAVVVSSFPDNEPFDVAQYGGVAVGAGNAIHVQPGTGAVFPVSDNGDSITVDGEVSISSGDITETNSGDILTALQIIDDWDSSDACKVVGNVAHDAADSGGPVKIGGKALTAFDEGTSDSDRVDGFFSKYGQFIVQQDAPDDIMKHTDDTSSTATTYTLLDPTAGYRAVITDIFVSTDTAMTVTVFDGSNSDGNRIVKGYFSQYGGIAHAFHGRFVSSAVNNLIRVTTSAAGNVWVGITYYELPA